MKRLLCVLVGAASLMACGGIQASNRSGHTAATGGAIDAIPVSASACSGWFYNTPDASIQMFTDDLGAGNYGLTWNFYLNSAAKDKLGSPVVVSMSYGLVNGTGINPPYAPHREAYTYNFHSSMGGYTYLGVRDPSTHYLRAGNTVQYYWNIASTDGRGDGYAIMTCTVA
ncbi:MAG: hypothetical protein ACREN1_08120 [Candidatus Dormibacteria bacterium]